MGLPTVPSPRMEGMVQGHDGRGLGQTVALDDREAEVAPELLQCRIERGAADDEAPELPCRTVCGHSPVTPPAPPELLRCQAPASAVSGWTTDHVLLSTSRIFGTETSTEIRRDLIWRTISLGVLAALEDHRAGEHRRNEDRHRLTEHVAQRQQVEKAYRREGRAYLRYFSTSLLDGHDVGQNVAVRDDNALGLGRRART